MTTRTPTDPLYGDQWHFGLIGDIETIWAEYDGTGVTVGVYDDGIDYTHTDIDDNYDASLHFVDGTGTTYDPMTTTGAHGMAVAGLIGAEWDNGAGGTGVAAGVSLTAVNFVGDLQFQSGSIVYQSLEWAQNFDIMNNSWGEPSGYGYDPFYIDGLFPPTPDLDPAGSLGDVNARSYQWQQAYETAIVNGRGGLGTVIVQSAGNDGTNAAGYGLNNSRYNITVGATDEFGAAASYSNWGTSLLVSAPAASVTTDLPDREGTNTTPGPGGDYMTDFSGTSAAAPVVSGVVALMLEANPNLGWRDVQNILAISASMTGSVYGNAASGHEMSTWDANGATNWNGGGNSFNLSYGFGMVDAFAAVRMAEVWSEFYAAPQVWANEEEAGVDYGGAAVAIADAVSNGDPGAGTTLTINVPYDMVIENIAVTIDVTHSAAADLVFWLIAPDGTEIPFMVQEGYPFTDAFTGQTSDVMMDGGFTWTFEVTAFLGMEAAGTWSIRVDDLVANGSTGTLNDFQLTFYGAQTTPDTIYHYTSDFLELAAVETGRQALVDSDGGNDWMNLASIQDDVVVDLFSGDLSVNATHWSSIGYGIENAATGDGNDKFIGNDLDNTFIGGRGNDELDGGLGNDTLDGGAGIDWLLGREGNDVLRAGDGGDALFGDDGDDALYGEGGDDGLNGGAGADILDGGAGVDWLYGGSGNDTMRGGADLDALFGEDGDDVMDGGDGGDSLDGGYGNDFMEGGAGVDWLYGSFGSDTMYGATAAVDSDDTDALFGQEGDDFLYGGGGGDSLDGGADHDQIFGGNGDDWLYGQSGDDILFGEDGSDVLFGGDGNDVLAGGLVGDSLDGGAGDDILFGGEGVDVLWGGLGADQFAYSLPNEGEDLIRDFVSGEDQILLDATGFGLGFSGSIVGQNMFQTGSGLPTDFGASGAVIYFETTYNSIWFDADGGTSDNAEILASLETGSLTESDIVVYSDLVSA